MLTNTEVLLLKLLAKKNIDGPLFYGVDTGKLINLAINHRVLPFVYKDILKYSPIITDDNKRSIYKTLDNTVKLNYRLFAEGAYIVKELNKNDISCCILKGAATAALYPVPELRGQTDIDILLEDKNDLDKALDLLRGLGAVVNAQQHSFHHIVCTLKSGTLVEIHTLLVEPVDNKAFNAKIENITAGGDPPGSTFEKIDLLGIKIPALKRHLHAFELMVHMTEHFMLVGFSLRFLYDWVIFWENADMDEHDKSGYLELVKAAGIKKFSDTVTLCCIEYLGLNREKTDFMGIDTDVPCKEFLREVFDSVDPERGSSNRMLSLKNDSVFEYIREFHHQMHRNFPNTGNIFILWPFMWAFTLGRFLYNNKKLGRAGAASFIKNAGERAKLTKKLMIYEK